MKKTLLILLPLLVIFLLSGWVYMRYFFVFGEGVKSGYLNYAVYKGDVFKTYEGKLIQEGFAKTRTGSGIQSNVYSNSWKSIVANTLTSTIRNFTMRCHGVAIRYIL